MAKAGQHRKEQVGTATVMQVAITEAVIECPVDRRMAANILGVSESTLDSWSAMGLIAHLKYDVRGRKGGRVLYLPSELLRFRQEHNVSVRDIGAEVEKMILK